MWISNPFANRRVVIHFAEDNTSVNAGKKKWRPPMNCFPCYSYGSNLRSDGEVEAPLECKDPTGCRGSFGFRPGRVVMMSRQGSCSFRSTAPQKFADTSPRPLASSMEKPSTLRRLRRRSAKSSRWFSPTMKPNDKGDSYQVPQAINGILLAKYHL